MKKIYSIIVMVLVLCAISCTKQNLVENKGMGALCFDMNISAKTRALTDDQLTSTAKVNIYLICSYISSLEYLSGCLAYLHNLKYKYGTRQKFLKHIKTILFKI